MLDKPSDEVLAALASMAKRAEWQVLETWLKSSRESCVKRSLDADTTKSRQAQGGIVLLDEFFHQTTAATELARR